MRIVGTSSALFATTEGTQKEPEGSWGLAELEESLTVTSKSRRSGERLKATTRKCWKTIFAAVRRGQEMFCGCSRLRFGVRVIYGMTLIKSVFKKLFRLSYVL